MFEEIYKNLSEELSIGKECTLLTYLNPLTENKGTIHKKICLTKSNLLQNPLDDVILQENILQSFSTGTPLLYKGETESILIEPFFPKPRLIILGAGHIAKPLAEFGNKVGFSIVVVDDRPSFANTARFPDAEQVICEDFNKVFDILDIRECDFVVIVTRGHRHDGVCLRNTLSFNPAYIGMIGSKRRVREMMIQLEGEGYPKERLDSVYSPIGIDIGAVTPEEIAISIIAELISCRRALGAKISNNSKFNWPEFDNEVVNESCQQSEVPRALVTIVSSKGSVPRKAGAKMIVWLDGRTLGSIGGGCSEANIATLAREAILTKKYSIEHVDMTGIVAEDEGMVCGGTMNVLIESL